MLVLRLLCIAFLLVFFLIGINVCSSHKAGCEQTYTCVYVSSRKRICWYRGVNVTKKLLNRLVILRKRFLGVLGEGRGFVCHAQDQKEEKMLQIASPVNQISPRAAPHAPSMVKLKSFLLLLFNTRKEYKKYV